MVILREPRAGRLRRCVVSLLLLVATGCLEDLQAVGPGKSLTAPLSPIEVKAGEASQVFAQVLDVNKDGVDGAYVMFVRTDSSRIVWTDATQDANAATIKTSSGAPFGIVGRGVASAAFSVPADAMTGQADVIAVLKEPGVDEDTIEVRVAVNVTAAGGTGGAGGGSGTGGMEGELSDAGGAGGT